MTEKYDVNSDYVIDGATLEALWRVSLRFNDGTKLDPNERRDLAQRIQALLDRLTLYKVTD